MKFKCLILDHDDTVVNSTATIHFPCFIQYLREKFPHLADNYTLDDYFRKNFDPGVISLFRDEIGLTEEEMKAEEQYWKDYVRSHVPSFYPGIPEIIADFKKEGGIVAVASHSFEHYIRRDYELSGVTMPDVIYGWDLPNERRKPSPYAALDVMKRYSLLPSEVLVVDDLKPGYDMARGAGVRFAAAGWAYAVAEIEQCMRKNCDYYLKSTDQLRKLLF